MDWVTGLPPADDRGCHSFLVIVERLSKTPISLPCHKDDTSMDTTLLIWNRVVSWTAYHPQTDSLAEIMIQKLEDMVRNICAYGLELKYCDGFPHDWCALIPTKEISLRNEVPQNISPVSSSGTREITKALRERKVMTKKVR
ncbi:hypothetical protein O181_069360 [Austropuccinia psidii MF-1]|uniref:Integrase catalytic domain-containing protein n=1 Tax=Austropuccinia psidii MF-1 TaxID=1389203 RepID=A0A9Q3I807_9BASI|nr:hypothetical protein [Austropuccinia psidii MF-1]